jgi:hypothetical protein
MGEQPGSYRRAGHRAEHRTIKVIVTKKLRTINL